MQITDVRVRKIEKEGKMKAIVSITLDGEFVVHDIKVIEGEKGLFIAMPSRRAGDGEYRDIAHPINSQTREMIQNIILERYEAVLEESLQITEPWNGCVQLCWVGRVLTDHRAMELLCCFGLG